MSSPAAGPSALADRIAENYEVLSKREKLLADAVLECVRDLAGYTATELASRASVSKATATRFFRRLGYNDFEEARREARRDPYAGSPLEAFYQSANGQGGNGDVDQHVARELENISETFQSLAADDIDEAVRQIAGARKVWILGFRDSYAIAVYASSMLTRVVADVRVLPRLGMSLAEDFISLDRQDVVIAIGFRRRPKIFLDCLRTIHGSGATIILLTDAAASFKATQAGIILRCHIQGSLFDSHISGISLVSLLCSKVGGVLGAATRQRLERGEEFHEIFQDL